MRNSYHEMRARHQAEFDKFPLGFAFSDKQFVEMMKRWGLSPDDTDKIVRIPGGGFVQKKDLEAFHEMNERLISEEEAAIAADKTGDGFIYEMFLYELGNHEFGYTGDTEETLDALGYSVYDIRNDARLAHGLKKAMDTIANDVA